MRSHGQVVVIVAVLLSVALFLLALIVDGGRISVERSQTQRAAQAAADAGIGLVAEAIVTHAVLRQTDAASSPCPSCTPTPDPGEAASWLTDDDRATLVSPPIRTQVASVALNYAQRNGLHASMPAVRAIHVDFPLGYHSTDTTIRLRVRIERTFSALLAGLVGQGSLNLPVEGLSQVRQR